MTKKSFAALIMAQLMSTTAFAQQSVPADNAATESPDIIVTAQKRAQSLQDVPIAVAVVGAAAIENSALSDTTQLTTLVPGLTVRTAVGSFQPAIRGITTASNIVENPVALYIDGVYMPNQRDGLRDLADIQQVAVLKGPQGTLFGRNATAGVIQITTRRPGRDLEGEVKVGIDNYATLRSSLFLAGPLSENLAASVSASYSTQGKGWGRSVVNGMDTYQLKHNLSLRGKLLLEAGDATELTLIADYLDREDSGRIYVPYPGTAFSYPGFGPVGSRYDTYSATPAWNKYKSRGASLEIDHDFGFAKLVSITSYRRGTGGFQFDNTGVAIPYLLVTAELNNESFTQELQLVSSNSGMVQWVAGVYYIDSDIEYANFPRVFTPGGPPSPTLSRIDGQAKENTESVAPFAQLDFKFTDRTTLTVGGRWTYERRRIFGGNTTTLASGAVIPQPAVTPSSLKEEEPTWRVALNHEFSRDVSAYASYNRGIKSGGFNIAAPASPAYRTEKLDAYEIGVKSRLFDRRLTFNTSAFFYKYNNLQVNTFIGQPTPIITNGAAAEIYGIDGDLILNATEQLTVTGGFQLMHTEFTDYGKNCDVVTGVGCAPIASPLPAGGVLISRGNATGKRLPLAQNFTGTLAVDYDQSIGNLPSHFNLTATYNGDYYFEADNFLRQPSYWMLNTSFRISDPTERASLTFAVTNILDESVISGIGTQAFGFQVSYGTAPRVYSVTAGLKF